MTTSPTPSTVAALIEAILEDERKHLGRCPFGGPLKMSQLGSCGTERCPCWLDRP